MNTIDTAYEGHSVGFRVSESPVFVPQKFRAKLLEACDKIFHAISQPDFKAQTDAAVEPSQFVPGEEGQSLFMQLDFGVCTDEHGELTPQLIEIQGFPSLYFFQTLLADAYRKHFETIPADFITMFGGLDAAGYVEILRQAIVGKHAPEDVILLEIEPEKQSTGIDFYITEALLGVKVLCLSQLKKDGKILYHLGANGERIVVKRIYNRVIFDELLKRNDLHREFDFQDDVEVEWAGHPNWFFRISKYTLPLLAENNPFVPPTRFLHTIEKYPEDLENYVLKPLFSFAGMGVKINVTRQDLDEIQDRKNYILQKKVHYAPVIETPTGAAKCEIRMMAVWLPDTPKPLIINNICRMSKGEMVGVRYNKDKDWVGGTVCFFE